MTSYLIITKEREKIETKVTELCEESQIDPLDRTIFDITSFDEKTAKKSWGIDDVKELRKKLTLKPLKSSTKATIMHDADLLTHEAQNALLKVLEEPPPHTIIILAGSSIEAFLPTIISRCQIIHLEEKQPLTKEETAEFQQIVTTLHNASVGERLKQAEVLSKNKKDATTWIEKALQSMHGTLTENPNKETVQVLKKLQATHHTIVSTNTNVRLSLEHLFLSI